MLDRLRRAKRLYSWMSSLEQRSNTFELSRASNYKDAKVLVGRMLARGNQDRDLTTLTDAEFQVFSQFGDDGIIQYLVHALQIKERTFAEFGVENYTEANTRFLLVKDTWSGVVMDGSMSNIDYIKRDPISTFFDLRSRQAFITAENIDELLVEGGLSGKIGLLSIDIDGVDYWVWKAITVVDPAIVVTEYNATFGPERAITVP